MIRIENLVKYYGSVKVLDGLNLSVNDGEIYGFIGQNGEGKSTTMNILTKIIKFQKGTCKIDNIDITEKSYNQKTVGYLPEDPKFYNYMSASEYLRFIGNLVNDNNSIIENKIKKLLQLVNLEKAKNKLIGTFSRGMKQRLGIAVAIYNDPKTVILDEPSSALDPKGRMDIVNIIKGLKAEGKTVLISTHILNDIERICDRIGILKDGKIIIEENLDTLLQKYIRPVYDVEFAAPVPEEKIKELRKIEYIEYVEKNENSLSVRVKDVSRDGINFIRKITELGVFPISINQRKLSLDEIFIKVAEEI